MDKNIVLFPHTHWDREWYKPFQDFRIRLIDVMEKIINELENGTLKYFYLDGQTVILEDYFEIYPEKEPVIKKLIKDKKLFIGPWYVLADEFLVTGESLIRNLLIGINQAKNYGISDFIGYLPDSFGHNSDIPRILTSFNIKNAILWRGAGNNKSEFYWESFDGSAVIATYLTEGYFINEDFDEIIEKIKEYSVSDKILLPVGGDHIFSQSALHSLKWTEDINEYFNNLDKFKNDFKKVIGELRDNTRNPILPATLSTRTYLKQHNAISTWKLSRLAEPLQVFLETNRKNELHYAWKLLLKNHPHDSICGCSVDEVHEENVSRFKQVDQISDALIERSLLAIIKGENKDKVTVCNLSSYPFSGVVKIKNGVFPREILLDTERAPMSEDMIEPTEHLVYVENIPPFSVRNVAPSKPQKPMEITEEIINMHTITDRIDLGDTYNYSPAKNEKPVKAKIIKTEIIEKNELRNITRIFYEKNPEKNPEKIPEFFTDIITKSGSKRIEFITNWENTAKDHMVQVAFTLPNKIRETITESTFGLIKREFDPDYKIENHIPAEKGKELKTNTAPMQRFVYTQGLGVITEGLHEHGVSENTLFITLLRATGKLSKLSLDTRNFPAGPPLDTPGAQCIGKQSVRYAICFVESPLELYKEADEFMGSIIADFGQSEDKNFLTINNPNIIVYGIKFPENGYGTIIRAFNISDKPQNTGLNCEFTETNSLEEPISRVYNINDEITFKPEELKTLWLKKKE